MAKKPTKSIEILKQTQIAILLEDKYIQLANGCRFWASGDKEYVYRSILESLEIVNGKANTNIQDSKP